MRVEGTIDAERVGRVVDQVLHGDALRTPDEGVVDANGARRPGPTCGARARGGFVNEPRLACWGREARTVARVAERGLLCSDCYRGRGMERGGRSSSSPRTPGDTPVSVNAPERAAPAVPGPSSLGKRVVGRLVTIARPAIAVLVFAAIAYAVISEWNDVRGALTTLRLAERGPVAGRGLPRHRDQPDGLARPARRRGLPTAGPRRRADLLRRPARQVPARQRFLDRAADGAGQAGRRPRGPSVHHLTRLGRAVPVDRALRRAARAPGARLHLGPQGLGAARRPAVRPRGLRAARADPAGQPDPAAACARDRCRHR